MEDQIEPEPPAPVVDAGPAKHWLDGRTVVITNVGRKGSSRRLFTLHMRDTKTASVTVYDGTGAVEVAKGNGYQVAIDKWGIDTGSADGSYRFEATVTVDDTAKKVFGWAFARENGIEWTPASAALKAL